MQDVLVNMMSQHLQLSPDQHHQGASMPPTPQVSPQSVPSTYITQHYHHSSHQAGNEVQTSSILDQAGVNASALLPSQIFLFKNADDDQKQRLVELWKIAPPTYGNQTTEMGNWPQTSMEHEEAAAKARWEQSERERLKNLCALPGYDSRNHAEPYIVSGYDQGPKLDGSQRCKDPVYNSQSREWWHMADEGPMEHQYGMLQQMMYTNYVEYPVRQDEDQDML